MSGKTKGLIALTTMGILFGVMGPMAKAAMNGGIPQLILTGLRIWGATGLFFLWSAFLPKVKVPLRDLGLMALAGLLGVVGDQGLFILGLSYTSPIDAGVITTMIPVFTLVMAMLCLKNRPGLKRITGILIGFAGAVIMVLSTAGATDKTGSVIGDLMVMAGMLSFACYLVLFGTVIHRYRVDIMMKWMFLAASVFITPAMIYDYTPEIFSISYIAWLELLYVIVGGTFLAFLFTCVGQKYYPPEVVGVFNYIQTIVGTILAIYMGLAVMTFDKFVGSILIFIAVWLVIAPNRQKINKIKQL